jgi:hypothetical protein
LQWEHVHLGDSPRIAVDERLRHAIDDRASIGGPGSEAGSTTGADAGNSSDRGMGSGDRAPELLPETTNGLPMTIIDRPLTWVNLMWAIQGSNL